MSELAIDMATRLRDPVTMARTLAARHESLWSGENFEERLRVIDQIEPFAHAAHDPEIHLTLCLLRITASLESGDVPLADRLIDEYSRVAIETRQPRYIWYNGLFLAMRALMAGEFTKADRHAGEFRRAGEIAKDANAYQSFGVHIAIRRWEQNESLELLPAIDSYISSYPSVNAWRCVRIFLNEDVSQLNKARREYEVFARRDFENILANPNRLVSMCLLAEACAKLQDSERAPTLYEKLAPESGRFAIIGYSTGFFGSVCERLGLLAALLRDHKTSMNHFSEAIDSHTEIGATPWVARNHYYLASELARTDSTFHHNAIEFHIKSALEIAHDLGMKNLQKRIFAQFHNARAHQPPVRS